MALTQLQALDKFCIIEDYVNNNQSETKAQFYARRRLEEGKKWALGRVKLQIRLERDTLNEADSSGLDM